MWLHARALIAQALPEADDEYLADALLAALSPATFHHQRRVRGLDLQRLKDGFGEMVSRILREARAPGRRLA
jgi:hypothetical protein